ncbi:MAG: hypothetical protein K2J47_03325, partial [Ruminococcus sp.]|nr:hypothetical protein [Ruminococcus sp.]
VYELPKCNEKPSLMQFFSNFRCLNLQCDEIKTSYIFKEATEVDFCTAPSLTPYICPHCGAPVRLSKKGTYYCFDFCGMTFHKLFGVTLSKAQVSDLLQGQSTNYTGKNDEECIAYPEPIQNTYNGHTNYRWKSRRC